MNIAELQAQVTGLEEDNRVLADAAGWELCDTSEVCVSAVFTGTCDSKSEITQHGGYATRLRSKRRSFSGNGVIVLEGGRAENPLDLG